MSPDNSSPFLGYGDALSLGGDSEESPIRDAFQRGCTGQTLRCSNRIVGLCNVLLFNRLLVIAES